MSLSTPPAKVPTAVRILRFDRVQRGAHWANALLFGVLIATAIPLYFGSFFGVVLERHSVQEVHLWTGLALPLPLIVSLIGPWGRRMRRDVARFNYWTREEVRWLRSLARSDLVAEKFNPGQKLNAIFVAASIPVMLITGSMLQWFHFFPVSLRVGATFVHDSFSFAIVIVIVGHIYMALTHRGSLRSMIDGTVSDDWAEQNAPRWLDEVRNNTADEPEEL
jgi:formate dehydrogenase subunit gamma